MSDSEQNTAAPVIRPASRQSSKPCLVMVRGENVGKKFPVTDALSIGRNQQVDLRIDNDPSVSRHHAVLERTDDSYFLRDCDSSYGTYTNGKEISEQQLSHGDMIRIGDTLLRFLCNGDTEAAYQDEIYALTISDPLTGIHNQQHFLQEVAQEFCPGTHHASDCCLLFFRLNDIVEVNEIHGNVGGDAVLRQVARTASRFWDDEVVARIGGPKFAVIIRRLRPEEARRRIENFLQILSSTIYQLPDDSGVQISPTAGMVNLSQIIDVPNQLSEERVTEFTEEFCRAADDALYASKRRGGELVVYDPDLQGADPKPKSGVWRRPVPKSQLIDTVQFNAGDFESIVACELVRQKTIIDKHGISTWEDWNREFVNIVSSNLSGDDIFTIWNDTCVIAAIRKPAQRDARTLEAEIRNAWNPAATSAPSTARDLRESCFASLTGNELEDFSENSIATLIGRLDNADGIRALLDELPYPISILYTIPPTRRNSLGRARAMIDVLDVGCRFLTAIAVSLLFNLGDDEQLKEMAETIEPALGRSPSLGAWLNLAFHLARLLPQTPQSAAHEVILSLLDEHENSSEFKKQLDEAVALRNDVAHGRMGDEEAYEDAEAQLGEAIDRLVRAMRPLAATRLVSVNSMQFADDPDLIDYELRLHRGPTAHFPIIDETFRHRLVSGWCYLIDDDNTPLALAPFLFVKVCEACNRAEMFLTEKLVFGPRQKELNAKGLTTNHEARKKVAWTEDIREFFEILPA